jgi:ATP-dependent RNA helicase MSS116
MQNLRVLIFDEADQLLDMGFRPAIQEMLSRLPPKESRQTLLFSATMPSDVAAIAKLGMSACVCVCVCLPAYAYAYAYACRAMWPPLPISVGLQA